MFTLTQVFQYQKDNNLSDVHLIPGEPPFARNHHGEIIPFSTELLSSEIIASFISELCSEKEKEELKEIGTLDKAQEVDGIGRFRVAIFTERRGLGINIRIIPPTTLSTDELNIPREITSHILGRSGLILISGPNNSGKTTILNSFINLINENKKVKIITFEDPIEYVHSRKNSVISQHQMDSIHKTRLREDLKSVFRQDANVVCLGEIRDADTMNIALEMCETGYLVMGTIHGVDAVQTLERIANFFPEGNRPHLCKQLATQLKAIVCQHLIPSIGKEMMARAREIMVATDAMKNLISNMAFDELYAQIETDSKYGNILFDQSLIKLFQSNTITRDILFEYAHDTSYINEVIIKQS